MGSLRTFTVLTLGATMQILLVSGCASTEGTSPTFDVPQPNYGQSAPQETRGSSRQSNLVPPPPSVTEGTMMKHTLRQLAEYDSYKMGRLVNNEINLQGEDDENYLNQVAVTLGQTVFIQPHFTERENALRELKGKIDQEDYIVVIKKAADDLISIAKTSHAPSDQAGALVALTNLVTEVRTLKRPELRDVLQKIADANLTVSTEAKQYAADPMEPLTSPSREAQTALKAL